MMRYQFTAIIEKNDDCYLAACPDLQGCHTNGATIEEALANLADAARLGVEARLDVGEEIPQSGRLIITSIDVTV